MTANVFEEDKEKSFKAGMNAHITKSIDIKIILAVLDQVLGTSYELHELGKVDRSLKYESSVLGR